MEPEKVPARFAALSISIPPEEKLCRYCLDTELPANRLISPCACKGSMKFVHEDCLKVWISLQPSSADSHKCDLCKTELKIEMKFSRHCSFKNFGKHCFKILTFPVLIVFITCVYITVLVYLIKGNIQGSLKLSETLYLLLILCSCFTLVTAMTVMLYRSIRDGCCEKKIMVWNILEPEVEKEEDDSPAQTEISIRKMSDYTKDLDETVVIGGKRERDSPEMGTIFVLKKVEDDENVFTLVGGEANDREEKMPTPRWQDLD
jgi:hypothetical protein